MSGKEKLMDLQRAKGLAIFLVVIGHVIARDYPEGNYWYVSLRGAIYQFHMYFFMFVSGYIMYYSYREISSINDYLFYVRKKALRFILPYFLFLLIVFWGKYFAGMVVPIENPVRGYGSLVAAIFRPMESFSSSLWYIYVLFLFYLTVPPFISFWGHRLELLIAAGFLYFLPLTNLFALNQYREYLFVFLLGTFAVRFQDSYCRWIDRTAFFSLLLFLGVLVIDRILHLPKWYVGIMSVPALHALVRYPWIENRLGLEILGKYTYPIYLMNTIALGVPRVIFKKVNFWNGNCFIIVFPIMILSGILLPILVQRYIISKIPYLRRIIY